MILAFVVHVKGKGAIRCTWGSALIIQDAQDARSTLVYEVQNILILGELDETPLYTFTFIFCLLILQNKRIELLLECFVAVVDA